MNHTSRSKLLAWTAVLLYQLKILIGLVTCWRWPLRIGSIVNPFSCRRQPFLLSISSTSDVVLCNQFYLSDTEKWLLLTAPYGLWPCQYVNICPFPWKKICGSYSNVIQSYFQWRTMRRLVYWRIYMQEMSPKWPSMLSILRARESVRANRSTSKSFLSHCKYLTTSLKL